MNVSRSPASCLTAEMRFTEDTSALLSVSYSCSKRSISLAATWPIFACSTATRNIQGAKIQASQITCPWRSWPRLARQAPPSRMHRRPHPPQPGPPALGVTRTVQGTYLPERVGHPVQRPAHATPLGEVRRVQHKVILEIALQGIGQS